MHAVPLWSPRATPGHAGVSRDSLISPLRRPQAVASPPTVSVVIPTHNRISLLPRAIRSVLRQSFSDLEVLVVDDGSTDGTARLLESFDDPRLRVLRFPERRGAPAARNAGIREARGAWIAFQDSDDAWLPDKLEVQMAALRSEPEAAFCYSDLLFLRGGRRRAIGSPPPPPAGTLVGPDGRDYAWTGIGTPSLVVRRDCFDRVGLFDETLPRLQDLDLVIRLGQKFAAVRVGRPLVDVDDDPGPRISASGIAMAQARRILLAKHGQKLGRRFQAHQRVLIAYGLLGAGRRLQAAGWLVRGAVWSLPVVLHAAGGRIRRHGGGQARHSP